MKNNDLVGPLLLIILLRFGFPGPIGKVDSRPGTVHQQMLIPANLNLAAKRRGNVSVGNGVGELDVPSGEHVVELN
jgi:hypothetical protein